MFTLCAGRGAALLLHVGDTFHPENSSPFYKQRVEQRLQLCRSRPNGACPWGAAGRLVGSKPLPFALVERQHQRAQPVVKGESDQQTCISASAGTKNIPGLSGTANGKGQPDPLSGSVGRGGDGEKAQRAAVVGSEVCQKSCSIVQSPSALFQCERRHRIES